MDVSSSVNDGDRLVILRGYLRGFAGIVKYEERIEVLIKFDRESQ